MFVGSNGKFVAAFQASALEDIASGGGCHALAKTMHAQAAADLGLICSLYHSSFFLFLEKMITQSPMG